MKKVEKLSVVMVVLGAILRIIPAIPANISPVAAMSLLGGASLKDSKAWVIPISAMALSDVALALLRGYPVFSYYTPFVYASFLLIVLLGRLIAKRYSALTVAGGALAGSILFFVITNLGVFLTSGMYPISVDGLLACYVAALPFFHFTLLGDFAYVALFFGVRELAARTVSEETRASSN